MNKFALGISQRLFNNCFVAVLPCVPRIRFLLNANYLFIAIPHHIALKMVVERLVNCTIKTYFKINLQCISANMDYFVILLEILKIREIYNSY